MNSEDFEKYYAPVCQKFFGKIDLTQGGELKKLFAKHYGQLDAELGAKLYERYARRESVFDNPLPEKWKYFLKQLLGPYGYALLKIHRIKRGITGVENGKTE